MNIVSGVSSGAIAAAIANPTDVLKVCFTIMLILSSIICNNGACTCLLPIEEARVYTYYYVPLEESQDISLTTISIQLLRDCLRIPLPHSNVTLINDQE